MQIAGFTEVVESRSVACVDSHSKGVKSRKVRGRFAPSPTGRMHAGNIFAALNAWLVAKSQGGEIVLRIEDLDAERSHQEYADQIMRDFESLGLTWDVGPLYQHDRTAAYEEAYEHLREVAEIYPCFCTRAELNAQSAPHMGEKRVYSGTCRKLDRAQVQELSRKREGEGRLPSMRIAVPKTSIAFDDAFQGRFSQDLAQECGDFLIRRSDGGYAYQLAVVVDDAAQEINSVVRGYDLLVSTPQQILLHELLGLDVPDYAHVPLFCEASGRRLAKRNRGAAYVELLDRLGSPEAVLGHVAFMGGLRDEDAPASAWDLLEEFDIATARRAYAGKPGIEFDIA